MVEGDGGEEEDNEGITVRGVHGGGGGGSARAVVEAAPSATTATYYPSLSSSQTTSMAGKEAGDETGSVPTTTLSTTTLSTTAEGASVDGDEERLWSALVTLLAYVVVKDSMLPMLVSRLVS